MDNEIVAPQQPPKRGVASRIFRILRRLFVTIFILLLLLSLTGFIIGYYYQDEVKDFVVSELNKKLNSKVIVDGKDIDFTVIRNFPYASVDFKNIKAMDAGENEGKDTLFRAGEISLQFNIVDIFHKNYHIKKIELKNADLRIRIDKNGNDNYHFWKESADSTSEGFSLALEKIVLDQVHVSYLDRHQKQGVEGLIRKSTLSGEFSSQKYSLETSSDIYMEKFRSDSVIYLKNKNIQANVLLEVDNALSSYKISGGKIRIEDLLFEVFGNVISSNKEQLINLAVKGKEMDIRSVLSIIPNDYKKNINNYESDGEFYFDATIRGSFSKGSSPAFTAEFGMKNASITQVKDDITLKNVNLSGYYYSGSKEKKEVSVLQLDRFSANINQGTISGDLKMKNMSNPSFSGHVLANTTLMELQKFIKVDTIETIAGDISMNATFSSEGKNSSSGNYENVTVAGDLSIREASVKLKNNALDFKNINGDFKFDNNDLDVSNFSGSVSSSDFELKGVFKNIIGFMLKEDQDVTVEATLSSKKIDLNELLANKEDGIHQSKYKLKFSEHIDVNLNSRIEHLIFRKFNATNIRGVVKLRDKKLFADPVTVSTMNGTITTSGMVDGSDSTKLLVTCFSEVDRINVTKMFEQFENFGQSTITDKNIKGVATAKINFISVFTPELVIDPDKIYAGVELNIQNGELNNVEAMKSLSRFIELKELESIRFADLKNTIEIRNQVITIPKMELKSSAINIVASGTHTFKNEINYKVKLSLNELLSKKAKKAKKENDEFGEVADDGLGRTNIFLLMTGTIDNPVIKYDSKSAIQNVKQDIRVEKQNLKSILKEEFGLFKKDSTLTKKDDVKKEDQTKFRIDWEESDKKEPKKELKKPKKEEEEDF